MAMEPLAPTASPEVHNLPPESADPTIKGRLRRLYHKYEKYSELVIFLAGFLWDALTLQRIDSWFDNIFLLGYLILIGFLIILTLRRQNGAVFPKWIQKVESRFPWIMQFCFGGLFSSYVVFYFKSASFSRTVFFFLLLVGLLIGNEFLEDRLQNRTLLAVLYSFCLFAFFAFFLPVVLASVQSWIFTFAGALSVVGSVFVFSKGLKKEGIPWHCVVRPVVPWILGIFLLLNVLYFANLIPPVPLALKFGHPYHSVVKTSDRNYEAKYIPPSIFTFWRKWDDPFYWSPGENVYCFTAIFAPRKVHVPIYHIWSRKTEEGWQVTDRMHWLINGGRDGGYRWYTKKSSITPGEWRVEVQTESGQILGEIDFTVKARSTPEPPLRTEVIR